MERINKPIKLHILGFATVAMMLTGCSDKGDEPAPVKRAQAGDPVMFMTNAGVVSRSVYSDEDEFQIFWEDDDEITIYSEQAVVGTPRGDDEEADIIEGLQKADYTVSVIEGVENHGETTADNPNETMLWSDHTTTHTFYSVFPRSRNEGISKTMIMKYHTNQECGSLRYDGNGGYVTQPDMRNAYMIAKNRASAQTAGHVILNFNPIMTTLDITVTAGQYEVGTGIIQPITVTGVSVIMPKYLKDGDFVYEMAGAGDTADEDMIHGKLDEETVIDGVESVFVGVVDDRDPKNPKNYLELFEGESLRLMAFLPPMSKIEQYQIKVHTTSGFDFIKTVNAKDLRPDSGSVSDFVGRRSRISVVMPNIYPDGSEYIGTGAQAKFGNNWISKLPGTTDLKKLSIPGFKCNNDTKAEDIEFMLNHGVRAFDLNNIANGTAGSKSKDIDTSVKNVFNNWIAKHPKEFVIVWLNQTSGTHWSPDNSWVDFGSNIKSVQGKIIALTKMNGVIGNPFRYCQSNGLGSKDHFKPDDISNINITNTTFGCHYLDGKKKNKEILSDLFKKDGDDELLQTGFTGIVMVPDADKVYSGGYTNSDLLIQGIIDCNYKFNLRK